MTKKARTTRRVKPSSATAARPRKGSRPRQASPIDFEAKVEEVRGLARPDVDLDLIRDYVKIGVALDEALAGRRPTRSIGELSSARVSLAERLGITPRERTLGSELLGSISEALASVTGNARKILLGKWRSLQEEIRLSGHQDGAKEVYVRAITHLREKTPQLFSRAELAMSPKALFERVFSKGRSTK